MKKHPIERNIPIDDETVIVDTLGGTIGRVFNHFTQQNDIGLQFQITKDNKGVDHGKESYIFLIDHEAAFYIARRLIHFGIKESLGRIIGKRRVCK